MSRVLLRRLALAACVFSAGMAQAHQASDAYLQWVVTDQTLSLRTQVALRDLDRALFLDDNDDQLLSWGEVRQRLPDIVTLVQDGVTLTDLPADCTPAEPAPALVQHGQDGYLEVLQSWHCEQAQSILSAFSLRYTLFESTDASHRGLLKIQRPDRLDTHVLVPGGTPLSLAWEVSSAGHSSPPSTLAFVQEGLTHIWQGWDHLAFLLVLLMPLLVSRSASGLTNTSPVDSWWRVVRKVIGLVSSFTLAHSLTLGMATLGWIKPNSAWVEILIAISVGLAALANLRRSLPASTWPMAFAFGLIHGFGFAAALSGLGVSGSAMWLPLLSFNLGVELGQCAVVLLFMGVVWPWRGTATYRMGLLKGGSMAVAGLSLWWTMERLAAIGVPTPVLF